MARKHTTVSRRMLFTWLMLGGFILLLAPQNLTGKLQLGFVRVFRWPLSIGGGFALTANTQQTLEDAVPRREYDKLQNHCDNLEETLRAQREKFQKLYGLHNTYVWEGADLMVADVITANIDRARSELAVKYGKDTGMAKGQYVLGDNSIIGTISDFSSGTAHVKLFTDPTSKMPARIRDVERVMRGSGDNSARILQIHKDHKVEVGDRVFASNRRMVGDKALASNSQVRFLDTSMIVGTVAQIRTSRESPLLLDIIVKPACDIEKLENVAIIIMNPGK
jgi:cell shape-determining protein MreC